MVERNNRDLGFHLAHAWLVVLFKSHHVELQCATSWVCLRLANRNE
jgi:hypothetical protein